MNAARILILPAALLLSLTAVAQSAGARGGTQPMLGLMGGGETPPIESNDVSRFVRVTGTAEIRVAPTSLRIVFAVTAEGETGAACTSRLTQRIKALTTALTNAGVKPESVVTDYVAMLPVYTWQMEKQQGRDVAVERRSGWILQHNVHVEVPDEPTAQSVIADATAVGVGDVVAVDHWHESLREVKVEAQAMALAEAQRKAKVFIGALFQKPPLPINFRESTEVVYPKDVYQSFENAYVSRYGARYDSRTPRISAFRPKNTYYAGLYGPIDVQPAAMPMKPEISVVATVDLYYESPAAARRAAGGKPK